MRKPLILAVLTVAALLPAAPQAHAVGGGFFNLQCDLSHRASDDPIVFPSQPGAAHLHDFLGNRSTEADSTRKSMKAAPTNCTLSADTSGYWAPTLLDGNGQPVPIKRVQVYYRSASGIQVRAFPGNLKIIAGGDTLDPPAPSRRRRAPGRGAPAAAAPGGGSWPALPQPQRRSAPAPDETPARPRALR